MARISLCLAPSVEDFQALKDAFEHFCARSAVQIPRKVEQEFKKRQKQCQQGHGKAKLDLSSSKLTDQHVECLADALVKAPYVAKLDLSGNNITVVGANSLVSAQQQQVLLIRFQRMPSDYIALSNINLQRTSIPEHAAAVKEAATYGALLEVVNAEQWMVSLILPLDPYITGYMSTQAAGDAWQAVTRGALKKVDISHDINALEKTSTGMIAIDRVVAKFSSVLRSRNLLPDLTSWQSGLLCTPPQSLQNGATIARTLSDLEEKEDEDKEDKDEETKNEEEAPHLVPARGASTPFVEHTALDKEEDADQHAAEHGNAECTHQQQPSLQAHPQAPCQDQHPPPRSVMSRGTSYDDAHKLSALLAARTSQLHLHHAESSRDIVASDHSNLDDEQHCTFALLSSGSDDNKRMPLQASGRRSLSPARKHSANLEKHRHSMPDRHPTGATAPSSPPRFDEPEPTLEVQHAVRRSTSPQYRYSSGGSTTTTEVAQEGNTACSEARQEEATVPFSDIEIEFQGKQCVVRGQQIESSSLIMSHIQAEHLETIRSLHMHHIGLMVLDVPSLHQFSRLVDLDVSQNMLTSLFTFKADPSGEGSVYVDLEDLLPPTLVKLNASHNRLARIDGLQNCLSLKELNLSSNLLRSVSGLEHLQQLQTLDVSSNYISSTYTWRILSCNPKLTSLEVHTNPVASNPRQYRVLLKSMLPALEMLDKMPLPRAKRSAPNIKAPEGPKLSAQEQQLRDQQRHQKWRAMEESRQKARHDEEEKLKQQRVGYTRKLSSRDLHKTIERLMVPLEKERSPQSVHSQARVLRRTQSRRDPQPASFPHRRAQSVNEQLWKRMMEHPEFDLSRDDSDRSPRNIIPRFNVSPPIPPHAPAAPASVSSTTSSTVTQLVFDQDMADAERWSCEPSPTHAAHNAPVVWLEAVDELPQPIEDQENTRAVTPADESSACDTATALNETIQELLEHIIEIVTHSPEVPQDVEEHHETSAEHAEIDVRQCSKTEHRSETAEDETENNSAQGEETKEVEERTAVNSTVELPEVDDEFSTLDDGKEDVEQNHDSEGDKPLPEEGGEVILTARERLQLRLEKNKQARAAAAAATAATTAAAEDGNSSQHFS